MHIISKQHLERTVRREMHDVSNQHDVPSGMELIGAKLSIHPNQVREAMLRSIASNQTQEAA